MFGLTKKEKDAKKLAQAIASLPPIPPEKKKMVSVRVGFEHWGDVAEEDLKK